MLEPLYLIFSIQREHKELAHANDTRKSNIGKEGQNSQNLGESRCNLQSRQQVETRQGFYVTILSFL